MLSFPVESTPDGKILATINGLQTQMEANNPQYMAQAPCIANIIYNQQG